MMGVIQIKMSLKERKEPAFLIKLREDIEARKAVQSRLKKGDLYDMKELEKSLFDDKYYEREIENFKRNQEIEKIRYYSTPEGQTVAIENMRT